MCFRLHWKEAHLIYRAKFVIILDWIVLFRCFRGVERIWRKQGIYNVSLSLMMSFFHVDEVGRSVSTGYYVRITITPQTTLMLSDEAWAWISNLNPVNILHACYNWLKGRFVIFTIHWMIVQALLTETPKHYVSVKIIMTVWCSAWLIFEYAIFNEELYRKINTHACHVQCMSVFYSIHFKVLLNILFTAYLLSCLLLSGRRKNNFIRVHLS